MGTWARVMEITVNSGEDLRTSYNRPVKKNAFVTIRVDSNVEEQRTRINKEEEGSFPIWNEKLVIGFPMHARFLTVEVKCGGNNKVIGGVRIPVTDFSGGFLPENYLHILSYRLRDLNGERNGIINLSLKVINGSYNYQGFDDHAINGGGKIGIGIPVSLNNS